MVIFLIFLLSNAAHGQEQFDLKDINIDNAMKCYCSKTKSHLGDFEEMCKTLYDLKPKEVKTSLKELVTSLEKQLGIQQDRQGHWKIGWLSGNSAFAIYAIIYAISSSDCAAGVGYGFGTSAAALNALYLIGSYAYRKKNTSFMEQLNSAYHGVFSLRNKLKKDGTFENI